MFEHVLLKDLTQLRKERDDASALVGLQAAVLLGAESDSSSIERGVLRLESKNLALPATGEQEGRDDRVKIWLRDVGTL